MGVHLHDVPEDGTSADLDHRLRPEFGLLAESRSQAAAQNHHFHGCSSFAHGCLRPAVVCGPANRYPIAGLVAENQ